MSNLVSRRSFLGGAATLAIASRANSRGIAPAEYAQFDALGLAQLVRLREVTPAELLDAAIARAELVNPHINAISGAMYDWARTAISRGLPDGPLQGVPFLLKDLGFAVQGIPSAFGSQLFANQVQRRSGEAVVRYLRAGLVPFARTAVPELGILPTTESRLVGITRNPYDLDRTAGGSSGGSAAAVAAGIAPAASASDGGGSIRIPASCCGLFGLKPTRARVPNGPGVFEAWGGLAVKHALTRSVRDSAALLDATAGAELGDSYSAPAHEGTFLDEVTRSPGKLRIALVETMRPAAAPAPECQRALRATGELCRSLGHTVEEATETFNRQFDFLNLRQAHGIIVLVAIRRKVLKRLRTLGRDLRDEDLEPVTRFYYDYAQNYTAIQLEDCRAAFQRAARSMAKFQKKYDVVLTPTLGTPPVRHGEITLQGTAQQVIDGLLKFVPCTAIANWTGQPAMSVPLHQTSQGLPIGVQFLGRFGAEGTLFRLAGQLEKAKPWSHQRPELPNV